MEKQRQTSEKSLSPSKLLARAISLHSAGHLGEAQRVYLNLLEDDPKHAQALMLLGVIRAQQGSYKEGLELLDKSIDIQPNDAQAHYNRGLALQNLERYQDAIASYEKSSVCDPTFAAPRWHSSLLRLTLGDYEAGWALFEWRWKYRPDDARRFPKPLWLGKEELNGKTILIHAEQGFGDTIQFCRYIPQVEDLGGKVIFEIPPALVGLISTLKSSAQLVTNGDVLAGYDFHCPLMSLPLAFSTSISTIPAEIPYLSADPRKHELWKQRLEAKTKPRVGLVWSGAPGHQNDNNRSIPLDQFCKLLQHDYEFYSLQKEIKPRDEEVMRRVSIIDFSTKLADFSDTAALISAMDLVISVDTAVAHLAGSLGKPIWILLPAIPDFRWMLNRDDSPWYPSARLFRQPCHGDWNSVITNVNFSLAAFSSEL